MVEDPDEIRAEIAETRAELAETAEALAAKADVKARAAETLKEKTGHVQEAVQKTVRQISTVVSEPDGVGKRSDVLIGSKPSMPERGQQLLRWAERNRQALAVAGGVFFTLRVMRRRRRRRRAGRPN